MEDSKPIHGFTCRLCKLQYDVLEFKKSYKACNSCNYAKRSLQTAKYRNNPDNKDKIKETNRLYRQSGKGRLNSTKFRNNPDNKDKIPGYQRTYHQTEKGRLKRNQRQGRRLREAIENINPYYCRAMLYRKGFSKDLLTPEIIEFQKAIILNNRLCKTLKNSENH